MSYYKPYSEFRPGFFDRLLRHSSILVDCVIMLNLSIHAI